MLSKCANPGCSAELRYLRGGRIFRLGRDCAADFRVGAEELTRIPVEHFWLCAICCKWLTLSYDSSRNAVLVRPKDQPSRSATSGVPPLPEQPLLIKRAA